MPKVNNRGRLFLGLGLRLERRAATESEIRGKRGLRCYQYAVAPLAGLVDARQRTTLGPLSDNRPSASPACEAAPRRRGNQGLPILPVLQRGRNGFASSGTRSG
jgi:hypothetical protein